MFQAQENFVAEIDGAPVTVQKGQVFAGGHAVVKLDGDRGLLFKPLEDPSEDDAPAPKSAPAAAPAVKDAG